MTQKRLIIPFLCLLTLLAPRVNAQQKYKVSAGLKFGSPMGATAKWFMHEKHALEVIGTFGLFGGGGALLYEFHTHFSSAPGLSWYFGGGGHCAYVRKNHYNPYADIYFENNIYPGVDGIIGLEYVFKDIPVSLIVDALPIISFGESAKFWWNAGFGIRYTFR